MHSVLNGFKSFYRDFKQSIDNPDQTPFEQLYSDDIVFIDPITQVNGAANLKGYLGNNPGLTSCTFDIQTVNDLEGQAYIHWRMNYAHPKIGGGRIISIDGISHIKYQDKITYHRDYYDVGAMVYEQLPLIGSLINWIKNRIS